MNNVYYSVEPYTGDIICHGRPEGSKNGYSFGKLVDAAKVAKGKLLANGRYVYDQAGGAVSNLVSRAGDLANNVGIKKVGDSLHNISRNIHESRPSVKYARNKAAQQARVDALTAKGNQYIKDKKNERAKQERINYLTKSGEKYIYNKNAPARQARVDALTKKGQQYMYENKSLGGQLNKYINKVNSLKKSTTDRINSTKKGITDTIHSTKKGITDTINSTKQGIKSGINDFIGTNITGQKYLGNNVDYVGDALNAFKNLKWKTSKRDSR